jgi:hypothetical protein
MLTASSNGLVPLHLQLWHENLAVVGRRTLKKQKLKLTLSIIFEYPDIYLSPKFSLSINIPALAFDKSVWSWLHCHMGY